MSPFQQSLWLLPPVFYGPVSYINFFPRHTLLLLPLLLLLQFHFIVYIFYFYPFLSYFSLLVITSLPPLNFLSLYIPIQLTYPLPLHPQCHRTPTTGSNTEVMSYLMSIATVVKSEKKKLENGETQKERK
jgi:hypothetical protein